MMPKRTTTFVALLCAAGAGFAPIASGTPVGSERTLTCDDGSVMTVEYVSPESASGIDSTFKISPGATGPAADARAFSVRYRVIYDENGDLVIAMGNMASGREKNLVTCTFPSLGHPGYTVEDAGFYVASEKR